MTELNAKNNVGIRHFLMEHAKEKPVSFHMPGHKGSAFYKELGYEDFLQNIMDCDITEIPGADNLFQAESIIKDTAEKYKKLYGSKKSFLLVNGTSGGIIASILSCVKPGGTLVMARNCHKSVFNALKLGALKPAYAYPEEIEEYGISGEVKPEEIERVLDENPKAEAVILPSPNYYGICSDIENIARIVHKRGKILIVDQAHGAHLKFMDKMPTSAEEAGADIIINSTHKTLASFTQSAVMNVMSERVSVNTLEDRLQMIESSSPSYIMMASLDINADIIQISGDELFSRWQENIDRFYIEASKIKGLRLLDIKPVMDRTKINIDASSLGITGIDLEKRLMEKGIYTELVTGDILMCMTGIGNGEDDYHRLLNALKSIKDEDIRQEKEKNSIAKRIPWNKKRELLYGDGECENLALSECAGRVCATSVIPYPPGIPLICPGEVIDEEDIEYVKELRNVGEKVIGVSDEGTLSVMKK